MIADSKASSASDGYPAAPKARTTWILARRGERNPGLDISRPHTYLTESERSASGEVVKVATIFLTNRECPWRCLMCDLWKNTLVETVPAGAIPTQIDFALGQLLEPLRPSPSPPSEGGEGRPALRRPCEGGGEVGPSSNLQLVGRWNYAKEVTNRSDAAHVVSSPGPNSSPIRQVKLYNSGSFFDPKAIPPIDYPAIAERLRRYSRVIVECHPNLINSRCLQFRDLLNARCNDVESRRTIQSDSPDTWPLEVAMGLETVHPQVLSKLNKRMTLDQFRRAADYLLRNQIAIRVFVLLKPPFLNETEALYWAQRSIEFAFDCGASVVSLIPTRPGNGALDTLAQAGHFNPPQLATLESALHYGIGLGRGRVFADVWDLQQFSSCSDCFDARRLRLAQMNLTQSLLPRIECRQCQAPAFCP